MIQKIKLVTFEILEKIAAFMNRHEKGFIDVITYTSILTYIPLEYFIFTPYNLKPYYAVPLAVFVMMLSYIILRIGFDLFIYIFFKYRNP